MTEERRLLLSKNTCPYCGTETEECYYSVFYFCNDCFQKWFGFTIEKFESIKNKNETLKKMFNNYKTGKPFISLSGIKYWYKNGLLHQENDQPSVICPDGHRYWHRDGKLIREED